jgi:hypothetical protein
VIGQDCLLSRPSMNDLTCTILPISLRTLSLATWVILEIFYSGTESIRASVWNASATAAATAATAATR